MTFDELNARINNIGDDDVQTALMNFVNDYRNQGISADTIYQTLIDSLKTMK